MEKLKVCKHDLLKFFSPNDLTFFATLNISSRLSTPLGPEIIGIVLSEKSPSEIFIVFFF